MSLCVLRKAAVVITKNTVAAPGCDPYIVIQVFGECETLRDALSGAKSRYRTSDVLASVDTINVKPVEDRIYVQVNLRTADGSTLSLNTSVGTP